MPFRDFTSKFFWQSQNNHLSQLKMKMVHSIRDVSIQEKLMLILLLTHSTYCMPTVGAIKLFLQLAYSRKSTHSDTI